MQANPLLSIVIPTYNRAVFLNHSLEVHIPLARAHNIQLFISDNASTDETAEVVNKRIKEYPLIKYYHNETNIGMDGNFERVLKYPQTEYVWLLGDTALIPYGGINYILNYISEMNTKCDAIVFNVGNRGSEFPQQDYSDQNKLLSELGWHMTCLSSLVFSSQLIKQANFERYRNTCFIQTGIIFEYIANRRFLIHWIETLSVQQFLIEGCVRESWQNQIFEIWTKRWANLIFSLPSSYELDVKLKCIMDHGIKSRIFSLQGLLNLRNSKLLTLEAYKQYSQYFKFTINHMKLTILAFALLPRSATKIIVAIKQAIKGIEAEKTVIKAKKKINQIKEGENTYFF